MPVYIATIFISAFLLFLIQPIMAKQILPWFGGSAGVWATCLVFFQFVLLFGYAYADLSTRRLKPKQQVGLHLILLTGSLFLLPVLPSSSWKPSGNEDPSLRILGLLTVTIGLPYFLLSSTSPLVQAWFARSFPAYIPYRLFALSNFASLVALMAYPLTIEPSISAASQNKIWSAAYAVFAFLCGIAGLISVRSGALQKIIPQAQSAGPKGATWFTWLSYSTASSFLLLSVTNHLCMNLASIPFLWIAPLVLYLLSFILCFDAQRWYKIGSFVPVTALLLVAMAAVLPSHELTLDLRVVVPLYLMGLFVCCMFCHEQLAVSKPEAGRLTSFYLMISLGGAIGALLVGVVAPYVLDGYFELGFGLTIVALLLLSELYRVSLRSALAGAVIVCAVVYYWGLEVYEYASDTRVMSRNFYGNLRTWNDTTKLTEERMRKFVHGAILHGRQYLNPKRANEPTSYYSETSGVGRTLAAMTQPNRRVGLIGLGAGTLAAYGRAGDYFRFYEINPQVITIARTEFTFLENSKATIEIALGDARLNLEKEPAQEFDLLVIDAFSGDAIPVHLITKEAIAVYLKHMRSNGVLAFNISNRYLNLAPVLKQLADAYKLSAISVRDDPMTKDFEAYAISEWVLISADAGFLSQQTFEKGATEISPPRWNVWTDDFNNLFQLLK